MTTYPLVELSQEKVTQINSAITQIQNALEGSTPNMSEDDIRQMSKGGSRAVEAANVVIQIATNFPNKVGPNVNVTSLAQQQEIYSQADSYIAIFEGLITTLRRRKDIASNNLKVQDSSAIHCLDTLGKEGDTGAGAMAEQIKDILYPNRSHQGNTSQDSCGDDNNTDVGGGAATPEPPITLGETVVAKIIGVKD